MNFDEIGNILTYELQNNQIVLYSERTGETHELAAGQELLKVINMSQSDLEKYKKLIKTMIHNQTTLKLYGAACPICGTHLYFKIRVGVNESKIILCANAHHN